MTPNEKIIKAFAECFEPELVWGPTQRISGRAEKDAWTANRHDSKTGFGFMIAVYGAGHVRCFMEGAGIGEKAAEHYGKRFAIALSLAQNTIGDHHAES